VPSEVTEKFTKASGWQAKELDPKVITVKKKINSNKLFFIIVVFHCSFKRDVVKIQWLLKCKNNLKKKNNCLIVNESAKLLITMTCTQKKLPQMRDSFQSFRKH
jgi:hypothetical protein